MKFVSVKVSITETLQNFSTCMTTKWRYQTVDGSVLWYWITIIFLILEIKSIVIIYKKTAIKYMR